MTQGNNDVRGREDKEVSRERKEKWREAVRVGRREERD